MESEDNQKMIKNTKWDYRSLDILFKSWIKMNWGLGRSDRRAPSPLLPDLGLSPCHAMINLIRYTGSVANMIQVFLWQISMIYVTRKIWLINFIKKLSPQINHVRYVQCVLKSAAKRAWTTRGLSMKSNVCYCLSTQPPKKFKGNTLRLVWIFINPVLWIDGVLGKNKHRRRKHEACPAQELFIDSLWHRLGVAQYCSYDLCLPKLTGILRFCSPREGLCQCNWLAVSVQLSSQCCSWPLETITSAFRHLLT